MSYLIERLKEPSSQAAIAVFLGSTATALAGAGFVPTWAIPLVPVAAHTLITVFLPEGADDVHFHVAELPISKQDDEPSKTSQAGFASKGVLAVLMAAGMGLAMLAGCTTQQTQNIVTAACVADTMAPGVVAAGGTIAVIVEPSSAAAVAAANAVDKSVHPLVQQACSNALAGSAPVPGTVTVTAVPVAPAK